MKGKTGVSPADIIERNYRRVAVYKRLFNSPDGKIVLEDLEERFFNEELFIKGDSHSTTYNVGLRDAVRYIKSSIEDGHNNDLGEEVLGDA